MTYLLPSPFSDTLSQSLSDKLSHFFLSGGWQALDLHVENIAGPVIFQGLLGVKQAVGRVFEFGQKDQVVPPGQLCNSLLHNWEVGPSLGKGAHVHEIGTGEPLYLRKSRVQILGQASNDLIPPALLGLPDQNILPRLPVEFDQFPVYRQGCPLLGTVNSLFEVLEPLSVGRRHGFQGHRSRSYDCPPSISPGFDDLSTLSKSDSYSRS